MLEAEGGPTQQSTSRARGHPLLLCSAWVPSMTSNMSHELALQQVHDAMNHCTTCITTAQTAETSARRGGFRLPWEEEVEPGSCYGHDETRDLRRPRDMRRQFTLVQLFQKLARRCANHILVSHMTLET